MATSNATVMPRTLLDSLKSFLYFPAWWYSAGLVDFAKRLINSVRGFNATLGFTIWVRNLFTPLFNQTDITSRIISFFLRLINIIIRGLGMLVVIGIHLVILLVWIIILPLLLILIFI